MTGYKQKISKKRSGEYVAIHIYDHEVAWSESVSDSLILLSTIVQQWHTDQFR